jgi:hypothetical protein
MTAEDWKYMISVYKTGVLVPDDPFEQLSMAIEAVFKSWFTQRAVRYREFNNIRNDFGTAVNVQAMVYGNKNDNSGTGVAFTRNPATGQRNFFGEYLANAEGEDVVAGIRTPIAIIELQNIQPIAYTALFEIQDMLERHFRDMQVCAVLCCAVLCCAVRFSTRVCMALANVFYRILNSPSRTGISLFCKLGMEKELQKQLFAWLWRWCKRD